MDVHIEQIPLRQFRDDSAVLIVDHYRELSVDGAHPLAPAWDTYGELAAKDLLHIVGAYVGDRMVGYAMNILAPRHLHYPFAYVSNDVLFVEKEHRNGSVGSRLMRATREWAVARGAEMVMWHAKEGSELHRKLDGRPRFTLRDIIYSERV